MTEPQLWTLAALVIVLGVPFLAAYGLCGLQREERRNPPPQGSIRSNGRPLRPRTPVRASGAPPQAGEGLS